MRDMPYLGGNIFVINRKRNDPGNTEATTNVIELERRTADLLPARRREKHQ
jgi:hypothetical protein